MTDPKNPDVLPDLESDIWNEPGDEVLPDSLRQQFEAAFETADEDDDGGLDAPFADDKTEKLETVSQDKGHELIDKARLQKPADEPATTGEDDEPKTERKSPEGQEPPKLEDMDVSALLDGIDDGRKAEITRRMGAASEVMSLFNGREEELKAHGTDAKGAMERLLYLNKFAQEKPDEYLAWVATQVSQKPEEALDAAAAKLGFKLVKIDDIDDDDLFADPKEKKPAAQPGEFGPDAPANRVAADLQRFVSEKGPDGKPVRPLFDRVGADIARMAKSHRESTGQFVTMADLQRFYDEAVTALRRDMGIEQPSSAAQQAPSVQDQLKAAAASAEKAARASKSIDGTGQGTSRRPALSEDADLDEVLRHNMAKLGMV